MSRSRKKSPYISICGDDHSMGAWKRKANRKLRRKNDYDLADGNAYRREEDVWGSPRDGKQAYTPNDPKILRK